MFLQQDDMKAGIRAYRLDQIIDADSTVFDAAAVESESYLRNILDGAGYDAAYELGRTGTFRDGTLLSWCRYLCIYKLYERVPDEAVPERVVKNYDDTIAMLRRVADGRMNLDLQRKTAEDGGKKTKFQWGSASSPRRR